MKMNQSACITGIGETPYSKGSDKNAFQLQLQASILAIKDAGIQAKEIDGVIPIGIVSGTSDEFIENLGLPDLKFSAQIPHGGASPVMALQCAKSMLESYVCKHILITFGRNVSASAHKAGSRIHQMQQFHYVTEFEYPLGNVAPAQIYAPMAKRYMELYGVSSEQFAEVAIVCRENAILRTRYFKRGKCLNGIRNDLLVVNGHLESVSILLSHPWSELEFDFLVSKCKPKNDWIEHDLCNQFHKSFSISETYSTFPTRMLSILTENDGSRNLHGLGQAKKTGC